ncbi:hypothetical protein AOLI_G00292620 [Acnodon oligacanthus]
MTHGLYGTLEIKLIQELKTEQRAVNEWHSQRGRLGPSQSIHQPAPSRHMIAALSNIVREMAADGRPVSPL